MRRFRTYGVDKKSGGGIPADCFKVEYLESTGTQYIDTGIVQSFLPRYVVEAQSTASGDRKMIGAQGTSTWASAIGQYGDTWRLGATGSWRQIGSRTVQTIIDFDLKTGNYSLSTGESGTLRDGYKTGNNIYIFATSMANDGVSTKFVGKIWLVKVYDESNALVFDGVPVRRVENGVSVGYMCDTLTGKLYGNSGTGSFVIGPDLYDHEVEYLESTGTQYIDTGFVPSNDCGISIVSSPLIQNEDKIVVGCRRTSSERWWINFGRYQVYHGWGNYKLDFTFSKGSSYLLEMNFKNSRNFSVDGDVVDTTLFSYVLPQSDKSAYIFAGNNMGSVGLLCKARVFSCKFSTGVDVSMDFIPVRVGDVGYMFDKVSGRLFGNAGSGEFVVGPDKYSAKDYVKDGLIYLLDGIENAGYETHDSSATGWTELVSNTDVCSGATFSDDAFEMTTDSSTVVLNTSSVSDSLLNNVDTTIELTIKDSSVLTSTVARIFFATSNTNILSFKYIRSSNSGGMRGVANSWKGTANFFTPTYITNIGADPFSSCVSITYNKDTLETVLFIDGIRVLSKTAGTYAWTSSFLSTMRFFAGAYSVHSFRAYSRALSDDEIAANYAIDKSRFGLE